MKEKELVTLRKKALANGGESLFLDYTIDGIRYKEYLKMYLVPEKTKLDKLQNIETLKTAQGMKASKIVELQNGIGGFKKRAKDILLEDYLREEQQAYELAGKIEYSKTIGKLLSWAKLYGKRKSLRDIDREYLLGFFRYLETEKNIKQKKEKKGRKRSIAGLSEGTVNMYSQVLSTMFNNAVRKHYIEHNPIKELDLSERPKRPESEREFLTLDEVRKLQETQCGNEEVKRAFLFGCFTGLRLSDVEKLSASEIRQTVDGYEVGTRQQKTRSLIYVPLSENALSILPAELPEGPVFKLPSRPEINRYIAAWVKKAGIKKKITFHCSRHTYATLLLTYGADIYTVSKLLGHTDVATTQIYAKVIDEKKVKAVNMIPKIV